MRPVFKPPPVSKADRFWGLFIVVARDKRLFAYTAPNESNHLSTSSTFTPYNSLTCAAFRFHLLSASARNGPLYLPLTSS